jgi:hypothetical protein
MGLHLPQRLPTQPIAAATRLERVNQCPLSGVKRTKSKQGALSAYDPKRTKPELKSRSAAVSCRAILFVGSTGGIGQ